MKTRLQLLLAFIAASLFIPAVSMAGDSYEVKVSGGLRTDNFDWNIAGNGVDVLSELTWEDLESYIVKVTGTADYGDIYLRGYADYGFVYSGSNRDSDYAGNGRTIEYSRSDNASNNGSVWDVSVGAGRRLRYEFPDRGVLEVMPLAGVSSHKQNLTITDGFQTIPASGPFPGLDSTYYARWLGPWAGLDLMYLYDSLRLFGSLEYHVGFYKAEADWNLRTDFAHPLSFEHRATGNGVVISLGGDYNIDERWSVLLSADIQYWRATDGTDRTFFANGAIAETRLNEVNWESEAFMVGLNCKF